MKRAEHDTLLGLVERILASKRADGQAEPPSRGNASASDTVRELAGRAETVAKAEAEIDARVHRLYLPAPIYLRAETHRQGLRQAGGLTADEITIIEEAGHE